MEELTDMYMWSGKITEETEKTGGVSAGDFSLANKHEPLDASHGTRIMAKEVGVFFLISFLSTILLLTEFIVAFTKKSSYYLR